MTLSLMKETTSQATQWLRRSVYLVLIILSSCVSMPEYTDEPIAGGGGKRANPVFRETRLALIYSENTRETLKYLQNIKLSQINFLVERTEDYDPHFVTGRLHTMLQSRFQSVVPANSIEEARELDVDLLLVFDFRLHKASWSGQTTSVFLEGVFLNRNDMTIDTIEVEGRAKAPTPYNVSMKPAASSALVKFFEDIDGSTYLMAELSRRGLTDIVTTASATSTTSRSEPERMVPPPARSTVDLRANRAIGPAGIDFGAYYALIIGNNDYRSLPRLHTAVSDARAMDLLLQSLYGFQTKLLINATRAEILRAITDYRRMLGPQDNLLIYFAGHGWLDREADQGYWLPVDATEEDPTNWISNGSITDTLRAMDAMHVLVIADSCYSGKMVRGVNIRIESGGYFERVASKKSRTVMASGGLEPVVDEGDNSEHSAFASALLTALGQNRDIIDATSLFTQIRRPVMLSADQTPEYSDIRKAGHDGGDFVFVRQDQRP